MSKVPKQLEGLTFKPGQSGNPGGRPKGYERQLRDVIDGMTATDPVPDPEGKQANIPAWQAIVKRAVLDAVAGDKYAREFVADRLLGKPKQHVDFVPAPTRTKPDLSKVPLAEKRAMLAAYDAMRALAGQPEPATDPDDGPPTEH